MKKILFILAVSLAFFAKADYIYWMVDSPTSGKDISGNTTDFDWSKAVISVQDNGNIYANSSYSEGMGVGTLTKGQAVEFGKADSYAWTSIGNPNAYTGKYLLIELFADDDSWMAGYSSAASSLEQYIFSDNSMSPMPSAAFGMLSAGATYAVPEPTSGLLFIIGGVLLGLKRRREVV